MDKKAAEVNCIVRQGGMKTSATRTLNELLNSNPERYALAAGV